MRRCPPGLAVVREVGEGALVVDRGDRQDVRQVAGRRAGPGRARCRCRCRRCRRRPRTASRSPRSRRAVGGVVESPAAAPRGVDDRTPKCLAYSMASMACESKPQACVVADELEGHDLDRRARRRRRLGRRGTRRSCRRRGCRGSRRRGRGRCCRRGRSPSRGRRRRSHCRRRRRRWSPCRRPIRRGSSRPASARSGWLKSMPSSMTATTTSAIAGGDAVAPASPSMSTSALPSVPVSPWNSRWPWFSMPHSSGQAGSSWVRVEVAVAAVVDADALRRSGRAASDATVAGLVGLDDRQLFAGQSATRVMPGRLRGDAPLGAGRRALEADDEAGRSSPAAWAAGLGAGRSPPGRADAGRSTGRALDAGRPRGRRRCTVRGGDEGRDQQRSTRGCDGGLPGAVIGAILLAPVENAVTT